MLYFLVCPKEPPLGKKPVLKKEKKGGLPFWEKKKKEIPVIFPQF